MIYHPLQHRCSWCMTCPRPAGLPLLELETSSVKLTTATNNYLTPIAGPKLQVSTQQHSIEAALTAELYVRSYTSQTLQQSH